MTMAGMLELVMAEWGADPVRITETWSDELLMLMVDRLAARRQRENDDAEKAQERAHGKPRQTRMRTE